MRHCARDNSGLGLAGVATVPEIRERDGLKLAMVTMIIVDTMIGTAVTSRSMFEEDFYSPGHVIIIGH